MARWALDDCFWRSNGQNARSSTIGFNEKPIDYQKWYRYVDPSTGSPNKFNVIHYYSSIGGETGHDFSSNGVAFKFCALIKAYHNINSENQLQSKFTHNCRWFWSPLERPCTRHNRSLNGYKNELTRCTHTHSLTRWIVHFVTIYEMNEIGQLANVHWSGRA